MNIPKNFRIKGKQWRVQLSNELVLDGDQCEGICEPDKRLIILDKQLKTRKMRDTFLHELFHAALNEAHIRPGMKFGAGLEEVICDTFVDLMNSCFTYKWKGR